MLVVHLTLLILYFGAVKFLLDYALSEQ